VATTGKSVPWSLVLVATCSLTLLGAFVAGLYYTYPSLPLDGPFPEGIVLEKNAFRYDSTSRGGGIVRSVLVQSDTGNKYRVRVRDDEYAWVQVGMRIQSASPFGGIERVMPQMRAVEPGGR